MVRENASAKGARYLLESRLVVLVVDGSYVEAKCRGAGTVHSLGHYAGQWWCSCPARGRCSHLSALMLVVVIPNPASAERLRGVS